MKSPDSYPMDDVEMRDAWQEPIDPEETIVPYGNLEELSIDSTGSTPLTLFEMTATEEAPLMDGKGKSSYTTRAVIKGITTNPKNNDWRWDEIQAEKPDED